MLKRITTLSFVVLAGCRSSQPVAPHGGMTQQQPSAVSSTAPAAEGTSLYKRLGGYDAIAAVTDDFLGRMIADRQLGRYFTGMAQNSREILREHVIEFICFYAKGPCLYVGRDLGEAHTGLHISESDWTVAVNLLHASLNRFNVPQREHDELVTAIAAFKEDIVGR